MVSHVPSTRPTRKKLAIALLQAEPARDWTIESLASSCGVAHRTLQKHFRRFIGRSPIEFLRDLRLDQVRRNLLERTGSRERDASCRPMRLQPSGSFCHVVPRALRRKPIGDLATPTTPRQRRYEPSTISGVAGPAHDCKIPREIAGFDSRRATVIGEELAAALCRLHWFTVTSAQNAHYDCAVWAGADDRGRLHVTISVLDAPTGRYLWADRWDDVLDDALDFVDQLSLRAALVRSSRPYAMLRSTAPAVRIRPSLNACGS